ncbi:MAG: tryptophan synthase subunit alpha [Crocinitomicaceae bacterium]
MKNTMNPFRKNSKQVSIFVTSGFPTIDSLPKQIHALEENGIDFIEVGIPFSDPMADGPTIQKSSDVALRNGMNVSMMFRQLAEVNASIPLVIMSYFNPIIRFGLEAFLQRCVDVGVKNVIIPDISLEVYDELYRRQFEKSGITLCFLVTPNTDSERITVMSKRSSNGFIYLVSSSMTTGNEVKQIGASEVGRIRAACGETPLMIGFGIRNRNDVESVHRMADGAIIGSAYIRALSNGTEQSFISELLALEPENL